MTTPLWHVVNKKSWKLDEFKIILLVIHENDEKSWKKKCDDKEHAYKTTSTLSTSVTSPLKKHLYVEAVGNW